MQASISRQSLRDLLAGTACEVPASVFDPLSARIAESLGFPVSMLPGSLAAHAILAAPDDVRLTLSELADLCRRICRVSAVPLIVDADHGYGGPINVRRTVVELEHAGVAGLTIEDTLLPAPFGRSGKGALISIEEGCAKMRAAIESRGDPGTIIIGRTSAAQFASFTEALARVRAYEDEGVDALFLVGLTSLDQLENLRAQTRLPLMLGAASPALDKCDLLARHGVRVLIRKHLTLQRSVDAIRQVLSEQRGLRVEAWGGLASLLVE